VRTLGPCNGESLDGLSNKPLELKHTVATAGANHALGPCHCRPGYNPLKAKTRVRIPLEPSLLAGLFLRCLELTPPRVEGSSDQSEEVFDRDTGRSVLIRCLNSTWRGASIFWSISRLPSFSGAKPG
jgi:hypothetical protein